MELFVSCSFDEKDRRLVNSFLSLVNQLRGVFTYTAEYPEPVPPVVKIEKYIKNADAFIAILTRAKKQENGSYSVSTYIQHEIGLARTLRKRILVLKEKGIHEIGMISEVTEYIDFERDNISSVTKRLLDYVSRTKQYTKPRIPENELEAMKQNYKDLLNGCFLSYLHRPFSSHEFSRYSMTLKNNGIQDGMEIVRLDLINSTEYLKSRENLLPYEVCEILKDNVELLLEKGRSDELTDFLSKEAGIEEEIVQRIPEESPGGFSWRIIDLLNSSKEMYPKLIKLLEYIDGSSTKNQSFVHLKYYLRNRKSIVFEPYHPGEAAQEVFAATEKVGFIFPGQGSQYVGMGKDLCRNFRVARETYEEADDALQVNLSKLCFEGPEEELKLTINTQPAILTMSVAALRVLQSETRLQQSPKPQ